MLMRAANMNRTLLLPLAAIVYQVQDLEVIDGQFKVLFLAAGNGFRRRVGTQLNTLL